MKIVKSLSLLSFLFIIGQGAYSQKQFKTYYDINNTKVKEVYFTNTKGEKEGVYKLYDEKGIIQQEANYKAGVLEGMLKEYYPLTNKACLKRTAIYKNGDVDGQTTYYEQECNVVSAQGNCSRYYMKEGVWVFYEKIDASMPEGYKYITYTQTFQADKMISESETFYYHPSKKVYSEKKGNKRISYSPDGKIFGEETYDQNGAIIEEKVFYISNGKLGKHNLFTTNGNTKIEEYNEWYENGNVRLKKKTENSEMVVFEEYDQSGNKTTGMLYYEKEIAQNVQRKSRFRHGKRKVYYDENWNEISDSTKCVYYRLIEYNSGKPIGLVKDFYATGEPQGEYYLKSDRPDVFMGLVKGYYKSGKLMFVNNYDNNGIQIGANANYNEAGKLTDSLYYFDTNKRLDTKCKICIGYSLESDSLGNKSKEMVFVNPLSLIQYKRIYITSKDAYELTEFHANGKVKFKVIAFYDSSDELKYTGVAEYFDEKGNVMKKETYDSQGKLVN